jgi:hypothetical protein
MVTYIVLIKGGASERCDFCQFGKRQFSNILFLAKLFFKTFISLIKARLLICMADGQT